MAPPSKEMLHARNAEEIQQDDEAQGWTYENKSNQQETVVPAIQNLSISTPPAPIVQEWLFPERDAEQYLRTLDPVNWKEHDLYATMSLAHLRFQATESDIKKAYRRMVLKHHPDKRQQTGTATDDDKYFPCILKAWDVLSDPAKRRSYDSVDEVVADTFDTVPDDDEITAPAKYYSILDDLFKKNARWSEIQPVPELGDAASTESQVAHFYNFWYDFRSWREYSFLDEEEKEKGGDRYERREIDKRNKEMRKDRKKEETARIRKLVELANANDPRIKKFKQLQREQKEEQKAQKKAVVDEKRRQEAAEADAARVAREEEARVVAEQRKTLLEQQRKAREVQKKALKAEQKLFEQFTQQSFPTSGAERVRLLEEVDLLCNVLDIEELKSLRESMQQPKTDLKAARDILDSKVASVRDILRQTGDYSQAGSAAAGDTSSSSTTMTSKQWHQDDLKLLIRALRTFPAGTKNRWEVVQCFIEQHSKTGVKYTAKDVVNRVKEMDRLKTTGGGGGGDKPQQANAQVGEAGNRAFDAFRHETKHSLAAAHGGDTAVPSERYDRPEHFIKPSKPVPWTASEQKLLERALKLYSCNLPDRWDMVAEMVSTRTKTECLKRYQATVAAMMAKKAADAKLSSI